MVTVPYRHVTTLKALFMADEAITRRTYVVRRYSPKIDTSEDEPCWLIALLLNFLLSIQLPHPRVVNAPGCTVLASRN